MRSQFADKFNHDEDALRYDTEVLDETDPIRAGYSELLKWVAVEASTNENSVVLDLGSGTGNLSLRLKEFKDLVCVDISKEMLRIANEKLASSNNIEWIQEDILEFICKNRKTFDVVVSTYSIHHLTKPEKKLLFKEIERSLRTAGRAVFGDLMFENKSKKKKFVEDCLRTGQNNLVEDIEDEFFWDVYTAVEALQGLGFQVTTNQFSELSWGIAAQKTT